MTRPVVQKISVFIIRLLRSPKFFYVIIGLLILQAAWIALTARYPQAFDENYHFGLIQLHARQWLPWFAHQPPGEALYGALARDPSYLYHFLLSIPYRVIENITGSQAIQVIILRFINIAIFVGGLYCYRKLLAEIGISRTLNNIVLLFLVLTPVVPLLAGQINYDNLMFLLAGLIFLLALRYRRALVTDKQLPVLTGLQIVAAGGFGSLVTFPFAAIFAPVVLYLSVISWLILRNRVNQLVYMGGVSRLKLAANGLLAMAAIVLCFERYGLNIIFYHSPVPKCHKVLSIDACQAYSPWARDHMFAATYPRPTTKGILVYPGVWVHRVVYESMFTITSTFWEDRLPNRKIVYYYPADPLPIANYTAWSVIAAGSLSAAYYWRRVWRHHELRILLLITGFYAAVLFVQNFAMYMHAGEAVAIHGRYLVPVYPVLYLTVALGIGWLLERLSWQRWKPWLFIFILVLFIQGAGVLTWIIRGEYWWYWPQSEAAQRINLRAQDVLNKFILR